jgi:hypothetical protein
MTHRPAANDFLRQVAAFDAELPTDLADAVETLREFGLELAAVLKKGRATIARFDAEHSRPRRSVVTSRPSQRLKTRRATRRSSK